MMQVRYSTHLQPLLDDFFERVTAEPLPPLARETVLIAQNRGLRPWLQLEWAKRFGCAASLDLPSPSGFTTGLARRLLRLLPPRTPDGLPTTAAPFDREILAWRLRPLLADLPEDDLFAPLRAYLREGTARHDALAREIAACFDRYQAARPELLRAWARGKNPVAPLPNSAWQATLWQKLCGETTFPSPAQQGHDLTRRLQSARTPRLLPQRITVFGADIFPPAYLRVLVALARHVPVAFYSVTATQCLGAMPQHPLLRDLGRRNRMFFQLLTDLGVPETAFAYLQAPIPPTDTTLHALQAALIEDAPAPPPPYPNDASLRIHACHSPVRELEVLRDQLFHAFETLPGLRPEDVLVLMTDPQAFGPLVEAVFGAEQVDGVKLPYHVADSSWAPERRALEAVRHLLHLLTSRFTGRDVLAALDFPVVRQKAGITPDELPTLRAWVHDLHVCWGIDGPHKRDFDLPDDPVHTWREALRRLMLGYALGPVDVLVQDYRPHGVFGLDQADLLGRFARWVRLLCDAADAFRSPRALTDWADDLRLWFDHFFQPANDAERQALAHAQQGIEQLQHVHHLAPNAGPARFDTVREHLEEKLAAYESEERYLTGRITFAPLLPLRFVPFRVIAVLGLNDTLFPRQDDEGAFDLTAATRQPGLLTGQRGLDLQRIWRLGDTHRRLFDQQLFLDTLLAAKDRVILTYVGRSQKDNSERAPSIVLDALISTLEGSGHPSGQGALLHAHRLQPFSPAYFEKESGLFSYAEHHCIPEGNRRQVNTVSPFVLNPLPPEAEPLALTVDDLAQAWINPSRYFCIHRLQLRLDPPSPPLPDREPLALDGLEAYAVKERLLSLSLEGVPVSEQLPRLRAEGLLPPGELGRAWFEQVRQPVAPLAEQVRPRLGRSPVQRVLHGPGWTLTARLDHLSHNAVLRFRCAKLREKDRVRAWATHLAANALAQAGETVPTTTVLFAEDETWHFLPLEDPMAHLQDLVDGLREIRRQPPPLFERASFAFAQKQTMAAAQKAFASSYDNTNGDDADPYVQLCFRGRAVWDDEFPAFATWASRLWTPLLNACCEGVGAIATSSDERLMMREE